MIKILFIIKSFLVALISISLIIYSTHIIICRDQDLPYGYGTFKDFIREFNKYNNWKIESYNNWKIESYKGSFFGKGDDWERYYIHAGIIIFDGKTMILYPISYFKFKIWSKKKWKEMKGIKKISWKN